MILRKSMCATAATFTPTMAQTTLFSGGYRLPRLGNIRSARISIQQWGHHRSSWVEASLWPYRWGSREWAAFGPVGRWWGGRRGYWVGPAEGKEAETNRDSASEGGVRSTAITKVTKTFACYPPAARLKRQNSGEINGCNNELETWSPFISEQRDEANRIKGRRTWGKHERASWKDGQTERGRRPDSPTQTPCPTQCQHVIPSMSMNRRQDSTKAVRRKHIQW